MSTKNSSRFTPVIIAISVLIGILIGTFYAKHFAGNRLGIINGSSNKLNALLRIVDDQYVDTVNMADLVEKAMPQILAELDPHSTYIPAQNLEEVTSELEGSFSGIGIQFTIQDDTIHVNSVIQGGPSEKVGLMAGDQRTCHAHSERAEGYSSETGREARYGERSFELHYHTR